MPTLLTRETFTSSDYLKIAATQATMFKTTADGEVVEEVPVPARVRETGTIPDGYSVGDSLHRLLVQATFFAKTAVLDFVLDPATVIISLKKQEIIAVEYEHLINNTLDPFD